MSCYKCKCNICINNTSETKIGDEFIRKGGITCFNCEDCYYYGHELGAADNHKTQCLTYIKSDRSIEKEKKTIEKQAIAQRKQFKVIK